MDWSNEELEEYQRLYREAGGRGLSLEESHLDATNIYQLIKELVSNNEYEINGISNPPPL